MNENSETTEVKQTRVKSTNGGGMVFAPGVSGNPAGRPKGSVSIKDKVRQYLESHPEDFEKYIEYFAKENRELSWQMLEGSPKATTETNIKSVHIELNGEDLRLAQELEERRRLDNPNETTS